jgi:extradiol dioxygenase family protein
MAFALTRTPTHAGPQAGLFGAEHFQMAYATNDIDRACTIFAERYGVREFRRLEGALPAGGKIRVELVWVGTIMYELLTASGPGSDIYMSRLPAEGFTIKHHHLGYLIRDNTEWDALMQKVEREGWSMPHQRNNAGFMKSCFVDAPELGHYLEYICPEPAGLTFFDNVPRL